MSSSENFGIMTSKQLIEECKKRGIRGYSNKTKQELLNLLSSSNQIESVPNSSLMGGSSSDYHLKLVDLFAGTGAFSYAFLETGHVDVVFANDMMESSKKIYDSNFGHQLELKDLHDVDVEDIPVHDILTAGFPCFVAGTKVLTDLGYKNIEDVSLKDKLLTHTGKFQKILNLQQKNYNGRLYSIDVKYHPNKIECTEEHPFYARQKNKEPEWVEASKLDENSYLGFPINTSPSSFNNYQYEDSWFSLGNLIGIQCLQYSSSYIIPEWIHNASKIYLKSFVDGLVHTQLYNLSTNYLQVSTRSYNLAMGLQRLFMKLGYIFSVFKKDLYVLGGYLMNKKIDEVYIENNYIWYKISSITVSDIKNIPVYNFEVENDNSYTVENIICHNCQPFSIAGKQQGFDDQRSNVFWKILEIVDYHQPRCIILENVKNLLSHDNNNTFNTIREELESRDYHINYKVLNTAEITGVPQHRERIYIVCFKDEDLAEDFSFDFPKIPKRSIKDFLQEQVPSKYYYKETSAIWNMLDENVVNDDTVYQYRRVYVRENKSKECPTLTANMGEGGHNVPIILDENGIRKLTPRECFNFQGFPDIYQIPKELSDCKLYKLAGNAVSLPVVKLLANKIVPMLM